MREGAKKRTPATPSARILLVDDEEAILQTMRSILETEGYAVETASGGREALELFRQAPCDVALCDVKMQGMDGIELLVALREIAPELPVIMLSGHGTIDTAVESLKKGAYDYIQKPLDLNRLLVSLRNALERTSLVEETQRLRQRVQQDSELIGESEAIQDVRAMMRRVAATHARVPAKMVRGRNWSRGVSTN